MTRGPITRTLGLTSGEAELLIGRATARLGKRGFELRALAFALATAPGLRQLVPRRLRLRAITPLLHALLPGPSENLLYAQGQRPGSGGRRDG